MASIKDRINTSTNSVLNGKDLIAKAINNNLGGSASKTETFKSLSDKITGGSQDTGNPTKVIVKSLNERDYTTMRYPYSYNGVVYSLSQTDSGIGRYDIENNILTTFKTGSGDYDVTKSMSCTNNFLGEYVIIINRHYNYSGDKKYSYSIRKLNLSTESYTILIASKNNESLSLPSSISYEDSERNNILVFRSNKYIDKFNIVSNTLTTVHSSSGYLSDLSYGELNSAYFTSDNIYLVYEPYRKDSYNYESSIFELHLSTSTYSRIKDAETPFVPDLIKPSPIVVNEDRIKVGYLSAPLGFSIGGISYYGSSFVYVEGNINGLDGYFSEDDTISLSESFRKLLYGKQDILSNSSAGNSAVIVLDIVTNSFYILNFYWYYNNRIDIYEVYKINIIHKS